MELAASCSPPEFAFVDPAPPGECNDDYTNGRESDEDCGGPDCMKCGLGRRCNESSDCELGSCIERTCQAAHCVNDVPDHDESDVDCGGNACAKCRFSQRCNDAIDCTTNACVEGECVATGCDDLQVGGTETDRDCGGGTCPGCERGENCTSGGDCESGICLEGKCSTAACADGSKGAGELGVDCGGSCPKPCATVPCYEDPLGCEATGGRANNQGGTSGAANGGSSSDTGGSANGGSAGAESEGGSVGSGAGGATGGSSAGGASQGGSSGQATGGVSTTGGRGGTAGTPTGGTSTGGTAAGGSMFPGETCPGCARIVVPLSASTNRANFVIPLPEIVDFSNAVITYRLFKLAGTGGEIRGYIQHSGDPDFNQLFSINGLRLSACDGWEEFVWNAGAQNANYDKKIVGRVGFHVVGTGSTQFTNPTIIYLDSITVSGPNVGPWEFTTSNTVAADRDFGAPSNVMFRNLGDDPVPGASVAWLGP